MAYRKHNDNILFLPYAILGSTTKFLSTQFPPYSFHKQNIISIFAKSIDIRD